MAIPIIKMATLGLLPSPLKAMIYRMGGAKIGKGVKFAPFSVLSAPSIEIGDGCKFGLFTFVTAREHIRLGKRVAINSMVAVDTGLIEVDDDSVIMEQCVIGGMMTSRSHFRVGKRVKIFPYCFINPTEPITIDDDVGVGGSTYIFTHGTWKNALDGFPAAFGPVHIKARVWLPWRIFILPGVTIGEDTIVAASSTVTKDIPAGSLAYGAPAKARPFPPAELDTEAKLAKLHEIFTEFADFERYTGQDCTVGDLGEGGFEVTHSRGTVNIVRAVTNSTAGQVVVSLSPIADERRRAFETAGADWFDLETNETPLSDNALSLAVYNFLGRYGIRFARP